MAHPTPELRIARTGQSVQPAAGPHRHFVGMYLAPGSDTINASLVRVCGQAFSCVSDVVATAKLSDARITDPNPDRRQQLADWAFEVAQALTAPLHLDPTSMRTISLLGFGAWRQDALQEWSFLPCCNTASLAATTGLSIVDQFAEADQAVGGRGGPCEAAGAWLMLSDRGLVPGRIIRALLDLSDTATLFLLPPRQTEQLPTHLMAIDVAPLTKFLRELTERLTRGQGGFEARESWSVQGRQIPQLIDVWQRINRATESGERWSPMGADLEPLLKAVANWPDALNERPSDVLCSAIHWVADRTEHVVHQLLPRSQPVGEIILAGELRQHGFLLNQLSQRLPEVRMSPIDEHCPSTPCWRSVAAALLGMLHVDQVPANSPSLTGAETPRVLGRITPGSPSNWHRILADMAAKLPEKKSLRSAV